MSYQPKLRKHVQDHAQHGSFMHTCQLRCNSNVLAANTPESGLLLLLILLPP
jgi:hypothetical protein